MKHTDSQFKREAQVRSKTQQLAIAHTFRSHCSQHSLPRLLSSD